MLHSKRLVRSAWLTCVILAAPVVLEGQSASPVSLQLSGSGLVISSGLVPGGEVQVRYTAGRQSLGGGYQFFTKDGARSNIVFVEPRLRLANTDKAALYAAARLGFVPSSSTAVYGGGGGVLIAASRSLAVDLGAQVYSADAKSVITQLRAGLSIGF